MINFTLLEIEEIVKNSNFYQEEQEPIISTKKTLLLLKYEMGHRPDKVNVRLLRSMHDLGMSSYKDFENTPLEEALNNLTAALYNEYPEYKNLTPLRTDFCKHNSI